MVILSMLFSPSVRAAFVVERFGTLYIEDQKGELWEIDQAKSIGFKPERFQYGIGRNTIQPLNDSHLKNRLSFTFDNPRVIGISKGDTAQAYSIKRLKEHEVANTNFNDRPIAAAY